jgi:two-component system, LytTR family, sensor kinase
MNKRVILHIGFWSLLLLLQSYIIADLGNVSYRDFSWAFRLGKAIMEKVGVMILQVAVFYWLFYYWLPGSQKSYSIKSLSTLLTGVLLSIFLHRILIGYLIYPFVYHEIYEGNLFSFSRLLSSIISIYSIVGIAGAIKLIRMRKRQQDREQQLIREKLESELHFLRAQVNPHFFFNTLNNIYGLARKKSDQTAESVMRLSKLMRFILYECTGNRITLEQEVKIIEDYIELEKLRYSERLEVIFEKDIDNLNQAIAPLLLLPFVENSFKHGASETRYQSNININLKLNNHELIFSIKNNKEKEQQTNTKGLGLQNVRRQLELVYPNNHNLTISAEEESFTVFLKINLS